jgi:integrase
MATFRTRNGVVQAIVRVKRDGQIVHQESRSFKGDRAAKLAKDWAAKLEATIKLNGVPARELTVATLGGLLLRYRQARNSIKPLRRALDHELVFLATEFERDSLAKLTSERFTNYAMRRRTAGTGPATILHNLATVRGALNAAKPMFGLDIDGKAVADAIAALGRLGAVGRSQQRDRRPTERELELLRAEFDRVSGHPSTEIPMRTIIDLAIALPRRREELCKMRWADYDAGVITLCDTKNPKAPRTERVPVPPAAQAIIKKLPVVDERILPYNPESVSAAFQRACERLKIEDLHLHDLRHEGITRLFEAGHDIPTVAMISGHLSWNVLRRYTHLKPTQVLEKFK